MSTISHLLAAFASELGSRDTALGLAHDVGHAIPRLDDDDLRELRNGLVEVDPPDPAVASVVAAMVEVIDGYRAGLDHSKPVLLSEGLSRSILCQLEFAAATTTELADKLECTEPQISRTLGRLRELDLVDPPVRDAVDKRKQWHSLSPTAKLALTQLDRKARKEPVWKLAAYPRPDNAVVLAADPVKNATRREIEIEDASPARKAPGVVPPTKTPGIAPFARGTEPTPGATVRFAKAKGGRGLAEGSKTESIEDISRGYVKTAREGFAEGSRVKSVESVWADTMPTVRAEGSKPPVGYKRPTSPPPLPAFGPAEAVFDEPEPAIDSEYSDDDE